LPGFRSFTLEVREGKEGGSSPPSPFLSLSLSCSSSACVCLSLSTTDAVFAVFPSLSFRSFQLSSAARTRQKKDRRNAMGKLAKGGVAEPVSSQPASQPASQVDQGKPATRACSCRIDRRRKQPAKYRSSSFCLYLCMMPTDRPTDRPTSLSGLAGWLGAFTTSLGRRAQYRRVVEYSSSCFLLQSALPGRLAKASLIYRRRRTVADWLVGSGKESCMSQYISSFGGVEGLSFFLILGGW
jgi:hypothetical protein